MRTPNKIERVLKRLSNEPPINNFKRIKVRLGINDFTEIEEYVWCLSTGRVGTQTISKLLQLNSNVLCKHEPQPVLFGLSKEAYNLNSGKNNPIINEAIQMARGRLQGLNQKAYIETSPHLTFLAPHLLRVFPNSKFIHIIRNPVKVVQSGLKRKWYNGNTIDHWRINPRNGDEIESSWNEWSPTKKNIWSWVETNNWIQEFFEKLPKSKKMVLKSEDLFSADEHTIKNVFQFVGETTPKKQEIEAILGKKYNASSGSTNSKKLSQEDVEFLYSIGRKTLQRYNYKIDKSLTS